MNNFAIKYTRQENVEKKTKGYPGIYVAPIPCKSPGVLESFPWNATTFQEKLEIYKGLALDFKEIRWVPFFLHLLVFRHFFF